MKTLLSLFFILSTLSLTAQKNSVYVTGGSIFFVNTDSINYERQILSDTTRQFHFNLKARAGRLHFFHLGDGSNSEVNDYVSLSTILLFGKEKKFSEFGLGYALRFTDDKMKFEPYISGGMRYITKYNVLVRFGLSFPEVFYLSFGYPFG